MKNTVEIKKEVRRMLLLTTSGFTQAGVYSRRQFCGDLEVYRPPEPLCNPRLREAATTLCATRGHHVPRKYDQVEIELKNNDIKN